MISLFLCVGKIKLLMEYTPLQSNLVQSSNSIY